MKKFSKFVVTIVLAFTLVGVCFAFTGCIDPKEPEPVYEIKLYDDNWVELEKHPIISNSYRIDGHIVEYDGNPKGFNVRAYRNGECFYEFDYIKDYPKFYFDEVLCITKHKDDELHTLSQVINPKTPFPTEVGDYTMKYSFYSRRETNFFEGEEFPESYRLLIELKIVNK